MVKIAHLSDPHCGARMKAVTNTRMKEKTARQWACRAIVPFGGEPHSPTQCRQVEALTSFFEQAIAAEREACAQLAEMNAGVLLTAKGAQVIATIIRARGGEIPVLNLTDS